MKILKSKKGITMISLIITIVVMLILTATIVTDTYTGSDYKKYKNMCSDIDLLENKILMYYNQYGELPLTSYTARNVPNDRAFNTEHTYCKIDVNKLKNITLNYGQKRDDEEDDDDIFVIDTQNFEVYYLKGIEYEGTIYYTN